MVKVGPPPGWISERAAAGVTTLAAPPPRTVRRLMRLRRPDIGQSLKNLSPPPPVGGVAAPVVCQTLIESKVIGNCDVDSVPKHSLAL